MAVTQLPDGRWVCYYRVRGDDGKSRIKKEYFGRGPKAEAAARDRDNGLGLKSRRPRKASYGPAFAELAESYLKNKNFSRNSRQHLNIRLHSTILPFFGGLPAVRITDQDVDDYVQKRRRDPVYSRGDPPKILRRGVKNSTIARELTDVKAILNWSVKRRPPLIPFNPVRDYKKPAEDNAIILPPTQKETSKIIKHASAHLLRVIMLSYYLGLRPGAVELLQLTWADVNFESETILVRSAHKGGPVRRHVPLHEELLEKMGQWYKEDKKKGLACLIHYHGRQITKIQTAWAGALGRAGITRRIRPYDLRHNFITQALEQGADVKALSEIVGSAPETIMRHYQHVTRKLHRQTVAKIPALKIKDNKPSTERGNK